MSLIGFTVVCYSNLKLKVIIKKEQNQANDDLSGITNNLS